VEVAPCAVCSDLPGEIDEFLAGKHTYHAMRIFGNLSLVLCNFHQVDFGSFDPTYFSLPKGTRIGLEKMQFALQVQNVGIEKDKHCPSCRYRLSWLEFVAEARELHAKDPKD
jgi:hypothetical protein